MKRPAPGAAAPRVAPSTGVRSAKVPAGASAAAYQDATQQLVAIVSETGELPTSLPAAIKIHPSAELVILRDHLKDLLKQVNTACVTRRGEELAAADPLRNVAKVEATAFERISGLVLGAPTKFLADQEAVQRRVDSWVPGESCECDGDWWQCRCALRWEEEHSVDAEDFVKDELNRPVHKMVSFAQARRADAADPALATNLLVGLNRALTVEVDFSPLESTPEVRDLFADSVERLAEVAADAMAADQAEMSVANKCAAKKRRR